MHDEAIMLRSKKILSTGLAWLWVAALVLLIDRGAKMWAISALNPYEPYALLPVFNLTLAFNTGAAFSFLHSASGWQNLFLGGLALVISVVILVWLWRLPRRAYWENIALCFILGGALGNVWDRILYQAVIDFFAFHIGNWHFAIFNTADTFICVGAFMMIAYWFWGPKK